MASSEPAPAAADGAPAEEAAALAAETAGAAGTEAAPAAEAPAAGAEAPEAAEAAAPDASATPAVASADPAPAAESGDAAEPPPAADAEAPAAGAEGAEASAAGGADAAAAEAVSGDPPSAEAPADAPSAEASAEPSAETEEAAPAPTGEDAAAEAGASATAADASPTPKAAEGDPSPGGDEGPPAAAVDVENLEVPDLVVDLPAERPSTAKVQDQAEKLRAAVAGAFAEFGDGFDDLGDPEVQSALSDWKAKLDGHVAELQSIVRNKLSPTADRTMEASPLDATGLEGERPEEKTDEILDDVPNVRSVRHQLESHRTGREMSEVASAWADPEETEKEVSELRRVRRQIRYLFGGMLGSLPESSNLRVDDLISDNLDGESLTQAASSPLVKKSPRPPARQPDGPISAAVAGMPEAAQLKAALAAEMPQATTPRQARPRSGGTESLGSVTNSSATTWNSQNTQRGGDREEEDQRRRAERRERRHRHREHRSADPPREAKKDDGAMPPKQWNWAEEVVKASLDPGNQWEFPGAGGGSAAGTPSRAPRRGQQPSWEQPRQAPPRPPGQRGADIASKARERAEQVMRSERERDAVEVAGFR